MDARARFVGFGGCLLAEGGSIAVCSWQCGFCMNVLLCEVVCILNACSDTHVVFFLLDLTLIVCVVDFVHFNQWLVNVDNCNLNANTACQRKTNTIVASQTIQI